MFTCAARASASTKIVRTRKGRSLRVDIHCHYLNPAAAQIIENARLHERLRQSDARFRVARRDLQQQERAEDDEDEHRHGLEQPSPGQKQTEFGTNR